MMTAHIELSRLVRWIFFLLLYGALILGLTSIAQDLLETRAQISSLDKTYTLLASRRAPINVSHNNNLRQEELSAAPRGQNDPAEMEGRLRSEFRSFADKHEIDVTSLQMLSEPASDFEDLQKSALLFSASVPQEQLLPFFASLEAADSRFYFDLANIRNSPTFDNAAQLSMTVKIYRLTPTIENTDTE